MSKPFWATVVIGAVSLLTFVTFLTITLDRNSLRASEQIFSALLADRFDHLADITLEYGYWNDAVENLVDRISMEWVTENFIDYMRDEYQIEGLHLVDGAGMPKLHVVDGVVTEIDLVSRYDEAVNLLIAEARKTPRDEAPVPANGLLGNFSNLYLASAVLMTSYTDGTDTSTDHVLVFAKPVNAEILAEMGENYRLPNLKASEVPPAFWQAGYELKAGDGKVLGYIVWEPRLTGFRLLPLLIAGLLAVFVAMYLAARLFFRRACGVVNALERAKHQADRATELLAEQARRDVLTGLGNRRYLEERLLRLHDQDNDEEYALLYVDLDRFKQINDTFGHETGDLVLKHVAESLCALAGADNAVFRIGGDEFIIVFAKARRDQVKSVGHAIVDQLGKPLTVNGAVCRFGASVGAAFSEEPAELLRQADMALYSAKYRGRGQLTVFSPELIDFKGVKLEANAKSS